MALDRGTLMVLVFALYLAACALPAVQLGAHGAGEFRQRAEGAIGLKNAAVWSLAWMSTEEYIAMRRVQRRAR